MKLLFKNKIMIITVFIISLFTTTFFTYELIINRETVSAPPIEEIKDVVSFTLNEPIIQEIEVNSEYIELGAKVIVNNIDQTNDIEIDTNDLNIMELGEYTIIYKIIVNNKIYQETRKVIIKDTISPTIQLKGSNNITLVLNEPYQEYGYQVSDNHDKELDDKVIITNNVNNKVVGDYIVTYSITDSSNNTATTERYVTVKKPNIIKPKPIEKGDDETTTIIEEGVYLNNWTNNGLYLKGKLKGSNESFSLKFKKVTDDTFEEIQKLEKINNNEYHGTINFSNLSNGEYRIFLTTDTDEPLINKLENDKRLARAKINNKLVTMTYNNYQVGFKIEDFVYQYDILIDPGHGGDDFGASNTKANESDINLEQTLYEYNRYRELGLTVMLIRSDNGEGIKMGDVDWKPVRRRAYAIGYYGVVSRISYSNHHNSINNSYFRGFEILVPAALTSTELINEKTIYSLWSSYYPNLDNHKRFYTRNYTTGSIDNKLNGEVYNYTDWYAVLRTPYKLFNMKNIIYEGCYMSNMNDFNWYYYGGNWKNLSEMKIKTYVEALGYTYQTPTT
ncbi:MAG: DUF5011 domain-containing protein [Bacilli bacterium]|nr:DUF5011 domain-containing protein [Bacilli bacterium]MDD4808873.1 DUF5011 domain-containing protein [Bacilli bacterium]